jgi:glutamate/tyrosine decarboxylase-like PLP-dependent enzyme
MGAGLYITRHPDILELTFRVGQSYMPRDSSHLEVPEPYARSMQWSRRFIGLKVFLALAVAGWDGYRDEIHRMHRLGERMKKGLAAGGWEVVNRTPLPLACFVDATRPDGRAAAILHRIAGHVVASGQSWISTPVIGGGQTAIRACISSHRTGESDVDALLAALQEARASLPPAAG